MKTKSQISLFLFFLFYTGNSFAQSWNWSALTTATEGSKKLTKDRAGNIYTHSKYGITGYFFNDTIKKITPGGALLWQFAVPDNMSVNAIVAAPDTGVYMAGIYKGNMSFGSATYTAQGMSDGWIARFTKTGNINWFKTVVSKGEDLIGDVSIHGSGVVITGQVADSTDFMGQVIPKIKSQDLFVATVSGSGSLQSYKFSVSTSSVVTQGGQTGTLVPYAWGAECETDVYGNIYLLATGSGATKLDTFTIGKWGAYLGYEPYLITVIKLNPSLQTLNVCPLEECMNRCSDYRDLVTSEAGESYVIQNYSYGQSGNYEHWSSIRKISSTGSITASYRLKPSRNSHIADIDLDLCGNLYYTGYWQVAGYSNIPTGYAYSSFVNAQLSSSLTVKWKLEDSTKNNFASGSGLVVLDNNDILINGNFSDTVQMGASVITSSAHSSAGFRGRLIAAQSQTCSSLTGVPEHLNGRRSISFYPNPGTGIFSFPENEDHEQVAVYDVHGVLVESKKIKPGTVDISALADGIYLVKIGGNGRSEYSGKIILQR